MSGRYLANSSGFVSLTKPNSLVEAPLVELISLSTVSRQRGTEDFRPKEDRG